MGGGAWCETVWWAHFRDARRILDWYHAAGHVWAAARALYADEAAAKRWAGRCLELLVEFSGIGLLRYLRRSRTARQGLVAGGGDAADVAALEQLIGYIEPRVAFMDYYEYRAGGYVIGSGQMEATHKQIVGQRLKGSGRQWSEAGALAMATLIRHRLNGDWNACWDTHPLRRAGSLQPVARCTPAAPPNSRPLGNARTAPYYARPGTACGRPTGDLARRSVSSSGIGAVNRRDPSGGTSWQN